MVIATPIHQISINIHSHAPNLEYWANQLT